MLWFYVLIFIFCCVLLYFSGEWVIRGLMKIARILGWREFIVAFFIMAFAASLPNLLVGIFSALDGTPELSFGDVAGNNLVAITLAVALGVIFAKRKEISADCQTIQTTSIFTAVAAVLPILLILDGDLSRIDGILLICFFVFYVCWLFSKEERFSKIYNDYKFAGAKKIKIFLVELARVVLGIVFLLGAAKGIVESAQFFAEKFDLSIALIGVFVVGLGNALPETYFSVISARRGEASMILGNLMGSVIVPATLVLGVVALICPIQITNFSLFLSARIFLVIASLFFFFFVKTGEKITKNEAIILLAIYISFLLSEIFIQRVILK